MTRRLLVLAGVLLWGGLGTIVQAQPQVNRFYFIEHKFSDKKVCSGSTDNGGPVHLWGPIPDGHEERYKFKLVASGEADYYYLLHSHSGKLVVTGEKTNGAKLHLWGPIPDGHQDRYKFKLVNLDNGQYYLIHKHSGKYLSSESDNGTPIHLWGPIPNGHENRYKFSFTDAN